MKIQAGDHLRVYRSWGRYYHHGIAVGRNRVIHFTENPLDYATHGFKAIIRETSLGEFIAGGEVEIVRHAGRCHEPAEVVRRARANLGTAGYNLFSNNCEHFATWCKTGNKQSAQIVETARCATGASISFATAASIVASIAARPAVLFGSKALGEIAVATGLIAAPAAPVGAVLLASATAASVTWFAIKKINGET